MTNSFFSPSIAKLLQPPFSLLPFLSFCPGLSGTGDPLPVWPPVLTPGAGHAPSAEFRLWPWTKASELSRLGLQSLVGFRQNTFLRKLFLWLAQKCLYHAPFQWQLCPGAHSSLASIVQRSLHCPPALTPPAMRGEVGVETTPHVGKQQHSKAQRLFETREWDFHIWWESILCNRNYIYMEENYFQ